MTQGWLELFFSRGQSKDCQVRNLPQLSLLQSSLSVGQIKSSCMTFFLLKALMSRCNEYGMSGRQVKRQTGRQASRQTDRWMFQSAQYVQTHKTATSWMLCMMLSSTEVQHWVHRQESCPWWGAAAMTSASEPSKRCESTGANQVTRTYVTCSIILALWRAGRIMCM